MKKNIIALCLCIAMIAIAVVSGTLAYFTDDKEQINTFTAGKLEIKLDEAKLVVDDEGNLSYDKDGNLVLTGDRTSENQTYKLFPGMEVTKDPTITLLDGSEDAYVAAVVTVTGNISTLTNDDGVPFIVAGTDYLNINALVSGGLVSETPAPVESWHELNTFLHETASCYIYQDASGAANNTWKIYVFVKEAQSVNDDPIVLFETLTIPTKWDNPEMEKINGMTIDVKAYAAQTVGFADCYEAMTGAFSNAFDF